MEKEGSSQPHLETPLVRIAGLVRNSNQVRRADSRRGSDDEFDRRVLKSLCISQRAIEILDGLGATLPKHDQRHGFLRGARSASLLESEPITD